MASHIRHAYPHPYRSDTLKAALKDNINKLTASPMPHIIMAGLGWLTGTMAAPLTVKICRGLTAPVVAVGTAPFAWEGESPAENASFGLVELRKYADVPVVHSLEQLFPGRQKTMSIRETFDLGVNLMQQTVLSLADQFHRRDPKSWRRYAMNFKP